MPDSTFEPKIILQYRIICQRIVIPLIKDLISGVKAAFQIPECLVGVTYFDLQHLPSEATEISSFGVKEIEGLANFYGNPIKKNKKLFHPLIKKASLLSDYKVYKEFVFCDQLKQESERKFQIELKKN